MQLKNDPNGKASLQKVVIDFYNNNQRPASFFLETRNVEWDWAYLHFLVDRKNVIRYGMGLDRNLWVGGVELAIGPHYFGPAEFWSYANSERFRISLDVESVIHNLKLLDEFWSGQE